MWVAAIVVFGLAAVGLAVFGFAVVAAADGPSAQDEDWQALVELTGALPDDVDDETRQLILDLLAETGGFAAAADSLPDNKLRVERGTGAGISVLMRAEGMIEDSPGSESGGGPAEAWRSLDCRTYMRVRCELPRGFTMGAVTERDPGERDALDHLGGYVRWEAGVSEDTVIGGDVVVEWGQHLIAGAPSFGTPGGPVLRDRLRGYDGAAESTARRAAAASLGAGSMGLQVFAARTSLDAGLDETGRVTTVRTSGLHVTDGERSGRDAVRESAVGVRVTRRLGSSDPGDTWQVAASVLSVRYDRRFVRGDPQRSRFGFEGDGIELYGIDVSGKSRDLRWGAELAASSSGEHATIISIEARPGRARLLLGADLVSRGFSSPLGASPPGASSGGNCIASWLRMSYRGQAGWSAWCRGQLTGHPWRTYTDALPPFVTTLALGGRVKLGRGTQLTAETAAREERGTSASPYETEVSRERRERVAIVAGSDARWRLWFARSSRMKQGVETGRCAGGGCSLSSALSAAGDRLDIGVTLVRTLGSAPTLYAGEPGLPGAFGLRALKGSGAGWYIRARKSLPAGTFVTARASRSASGEELTLGLALEVGTVARR